MSFRRFGRRLCELAPPGGPPWVVLRTVDSTNSLARRVAAGYAADGRRPAPAVFFAYHQSRGRGRGRHVWESPAGQGVYASLLLPAVATRHLPSLPLLAAVGLARGVAPLLEAPVALRWPNDLLARGRKLGGLLIESMARPGDSAAVVVGFGVNHGAAEPPVAGATSILRERSGRPPAGGEAEGLAATAARLVAAVVAELGRLGDDAYAARSYAAASVHRPGERLRCRTADGTVEGRFRGFDERGFLRLETTRGERSLGAGELIAAAEG